MKKDDDTNRSHLLDLGKHWISRAYSNPDNFDYLVVKINPKDNAEPRLHTEYTYLFVYNKVFAKYFLNDSPLAQRINYSDFVAYILNSFYSITIEKDTKSKATNSCGSAYYLKSTIDSFYKPPETDLWNPNE